MTSAQHGGLLVAEVIKHYQITHIFTLCGGHISPILIGCDQLGITTIDTRSEVNAVFAADAYARLSGKVGVAVVTAGPGVTNSITALKNAQLAESSLVLIGGATATMLKGRGALQDIEQLDLVKSVTKWQSSIQSVGDIVPTLIEAFTQAQSDVPGPVFVEMPIDILYPEELVRGWYDQKSRKGKTLIGKMVSWYIDRHVNKIFDHQDTGDEIVTRQLKFPLHSYADIEKVVDVLAEANQPVILASSQLVSSPQLISSVIDGLEYLEIPIYLSGMARGLLGKDHPLHYKHKRTTVLKEADVILLLGTPLDFRLDYGRKLSRQATAISVNLSKKTLKMNRSIRKLDLIIQSHPAKFLIELAAELTPSTSFQDWHRYITELNHNRREKIRQLMTESMERVNPLKICQAVEDHLDDDSIIVADGGDFVATLSYIANPRGPLKWLDPGPFGTLGVGAGFALGAKSIHPDATIWLIYGDGALGFSIAEFDSFVRHNFPVIAIVGNDASWQQIRREQEEIFGTALGTELDYTPYHLVVEGFGAKGLKITSSDEISEVLSQAREYHDAGFPVLVNVEIGVSEFRKGSISM